VKTSQIELEELLREVAEQNAKLRRIIEGPVEVEVEEINDSHYRTMFHVICPLPEKKRNGPS